MKKSRAGIVAVLVMCCLAAVARSAEPIRIIEVSGDGAAMGKAHGEALKKEIKALAEYLNAYFKSDKERKQALLASFFFAINCCRSIRRRFWVWRRAAVRIRARSCWPIAFWI